MKNESPLQSMLNGSLTIEYPAGISISPIGTSLVVRDVVDVLCRTSVHPPPAGGAATDTGISSSGAGEGVGVGAGISGAIGISGISGGTYGASGAVGASGGVTPPPPPPPPPPPVGALGVAVIVIALVPFFSSCFVSLQVTFHSYVPAEPKLLV